jgi:hypothetical protein
MTTFLPGIQIILIANSSDSFGHGLNYITNRWISWIASDYTHLINQETMVVLHHSTVLLKSDSCT